MKEFKFKEATSVRFEATLDNRAIADTLDFAGSTIFGKRRSEGDFCSQM